MNQSSILDPITRLKEKLLLLWAVSASIVAALLFGFLVFRLSRDAQPGEARQSSSASSPEPGPVPPLPDIYLDSIEPLMAISGNDEGRGQPWLNRNCIGQPLKLKGVLYARGVGEHALAELVYALKPEYARFVALIGLDDQVARYNDVRGSIVVKVLADETMLAETPVLRGGGACANVDVVIPAGAKVLRLVVEDAGDGVDYDDADFVNAGFMLTRAPVAK